MSYPSIHKQLNTMGATVDTATPDQMHKAFIAAFKEDLSEGYKRVEELVNKLRGRQDKGHNRAMITLDPNATEGRQFARLLGADMSRQVLEKEFDVAFGFYNCCGGVAGGDKDSLNMTLREQIEAQDPNFINC
jgi:hypothetical protein